MINVLITGVSTGFGKAILEVQDDDFSMSGISRNPQRENVFTYQNITQLPEAQVIILNAAVGDYGVNLASLNEEELTSIMTVNLIRPISFLARLQREGKLNSLRYLILMGSRFSSHSYISQQNADKLPGYGYCLSKAALSVFTTILRKESYSFSVNILHPGVLRTEMGAPDGEHPDKMARLLLDRIKDGTFQTEFSGIYELPTGKVIAF
ncbi:MAG: hypothetical protein LW688_02040 [Cryomorphaceae bacterium]|jgi:NAD(P)-dependent dehydrogenase (short-subunit alcohol dehydrogenase family)|nr:hypothetical protein [Cryomorphaceae bacterium]